MAPQKMQKDQKKREGGGVAGGGGGGRGGGGGGAGGGRRAKIADVMNVAVAMRDSEGGCHGGRSSFSSGNERRIWHNMGCAGEIF
jgi:hypothetical protein